MTREKSIKVRLTEEEFESINLYAKSKGFSVSEVIRDYIKRLPKTDSLCSIFMLVAIHLTVNPTGVTGVLCLHS
ncbi:MAG: DUF6290 family protein [Crinalium sp.]